MIYTTLTDFFITETDAGVLVAEIIRRRASRSSVCFPHQVPQL